MNTPAFASSVPLSLTSQGSCLNRNALLQGIRLPRCQAWKTRRVVTMGPVEQVTGKQLEEAVRDSITPLLIDIYAQWCGPCQFLLPELDKLAERMGDKLRILKLDSDEEEQYAQALGVRGLPTLMLVAGKECRFRMEGALTVDDLEELVDHYFFKGPKPAFFERQVQELFTDPN